MELLKLIGPEVDVCSLADGGGKGRVLLVALAGEEVDLVVKPVRSPRARPSCRRP